MKDDFFIFLFHVSEKGGSESQREDQRDGVSHRHEARISQNSCGNRSNVLQLDSILILRLDVGLRFVFRTLFHLSVFEQP